MKDNKIGKKTVFVSYCHKDVEEEWIVKLATALGEYGIECIVDIYDLHLGQDLVYFMEQIKRVDRVLILSGKIYKEKANDREGGVGTETQIISNDVYNDVEQTKFIPIVIQKDEDGSPYLPYYLETRYYTDFSTDELFANNIINLVNEVYGIPKRKRPIVIDSLKALVEPSNDWDKYQGDGTNNQSSKLSTEKMAIDLLKNYLESWIKTDFHNEEKKKDIEKMYSLYKVCCDTNNLTSDIIDIGYLLTDIFERESEYEKSLEITNKILKYYELSEYKKMYMLDKNYIRKMIGFAYGMAIAKVKSDEQKDDLLKQAEKLFGRVKELCEHFSDSIANSFYDKEFLWGIYYNDHAAFLLNKGDTYRKRQDHVNAEMAYKAALGESKQSLEHRKKLLKVINNEDYDTVNETKNMIARSTSTIGSALYRLNKYNESIEKHKEALKVFIELKDKDREFRTKEYIIGSSIMLWQENQDGLSLEDYRQCQDYMKELIDRYGDIERLMKSKNKLIEIDKSLHEN